MQEWKVDVEPAQKFAVPTFIRLFVTSRILRKHIPNYHIQPDVNRAIRKLVTIIKNVNDENAAFLILSKLTHNGIKKSIVNTTKMLL